MSYGDAVTPCSHVIKDKKNTSSPELRENVGSYLAYKARVLDRH